MAAEQLKRKNYNAAGFRIGLRFGTAQWPEDGKSGGKVFESVRFGATARHIKQLTQQ